MNSLFTFLQIVVLSPMIGGSVYVILCVAAVWRFSPRRTAITGKAWQAWPPVSVLKPLYGLEKDLEANLRNACGNYPPAKL